MCCTSTSRSRDSNRTFPEGHQLRRHRPYPLRHSQGGVATKQAKVGHLRSPTTWARIARKPKLQPRDSLLQCSSNSDSSCTGSFSPDCVDAPRMQVILRGPREFWVGTESTGYSGRSEQLPPRRRRGKRRRTRRKCALAGGRASWSWPLPGAQRTPHSAGSTRSTATSQCSPLKVSTPNAGPSSIAFGRRREPVTRSACA